MSSVIFLFFLAGVILIMGLMVGSSKQPGEHRELTGFEPIENVKLNTEEAQQIFNELKEIYKSGADVSMQKYDAAIESISDTVDSDYLQALSLGLMSRCACFGSTKGLQFHPNEISYFSDINCEVYTIQKLNKQITYGGIRTNINGYRTGTFSVNAHDVEGYKLSFGGKVFVTSQRVAIVGENKSKVIPLGNIISYAPYEKNGVIINVENNSAVILDLITNGTFSVLKTGERVFNDAQFGFLYALDMAFKMNVK